MSSFGKYFIQAAPFKAWDDSIFRSERLDTFSTFMIGPSGLHSGNREGLNSAQIDALLRQANDTWGTKSTAAAAAERRLAYVPSAASRTGSRAGSRFSSRAGSRLGTPQVGQDAMAVGQSRSQTPMPGAPPGSRGITPLRTPASRAGTAPAAAAVSRLATPATAGYGAAMDPLPSPVGSRQSTAANAAFAMGHTRSAGLLATPGSPRFMRAGAEQKMGVSAPTTPKGFGGFMPGSLAAAAAAAATAPPPAAPDVLTLPASHAVIRPTTAASGQVHSVPGGRYSQHDMSSGIAGVLQDDTVPSAVPVVRKPAFGAILQPHDKNAHYWKNTWQPRMASPGLERSIQPGADRTRLVAGEWRLLPSRG